MRSLNIRGRWLIAPALFLCFCSQGNAPTLTHPSDAVAPITIGANGGVGSSAAGDVKAGSGAIGIERLRINRQTSSGTVILGQYALPGGSYGMNPGETIELWAEWNYTDAPPNPRFKVEWGDGSGPDIVGCGSCRLTHVYRTEGTYAVAASLDDRIGTRVTRTFYLVARGTDVPAAPSCNGGPAASEDFESPSIGVTSSGGHACSFTGYSPGRLLFQNAQCTYTNGPPGPYTITFTNNQTFASVAFYEFRYYGGSPFALLWQAFDADNNLVASGSRTPDNSVAASNGAAWEEVLTISGAAFRRIVIRWTPSTYDELAFDNIHAGCK